MRSFKFDHETPSDDTSTVTPLLETQPLRERFREAERLTRELIQHLELGFLPKIVDVRETARRGTQPDLAAKLTDQSIRASVETAISSHEYTLEVARRLERYLQSIDLEVKGILAGEDSND